MPRAIYGSTQWQGCRQVSLVLEPPVALNTARISEGLLSLRFPRTRLFAASAPVCLQVLGLCLRIRPIWQNQFTRCLGCRQPVLCMWLFASCILACVQVSCPYPQGGPCTQCAAW